MTVGEMPKLEILKTYLSKILKSYNGVSPRFYGLPKIKKQDIPMR